MKRRIQKTHLMCISDWNNWINLQFIYFIAFSSALQKGSSCVLHIHIYLFFKISNYVLSWSLNIPVSRPQRVSLSIAGMCFDPETAIEDLVWNSPTRGVRRGPAEQNGLLPQIGPIKQVQGGIHVRYVFGCEGNRCLFTGRGGRLMAPSPLCGRACGLIKAAKLFIHTRILLPLLHTHKHTPSHANKHWHACAPAKVCMRTYELDAEN